MNQKAYMLQKSIVAQTKNSSYYSKTNPAKCYTRAMYFAMMTERTDTTLTPIHLKFTWLDIERYWGDGSKT